METMIKAQEIEVGTVIGFTAEMPDTTVGFAMPMEELDQTPGITVYGSDVSQYSSVDDYDTCITASGYED